MPDYPKPALTADAVVLRPSPDGFELLLIERKRDPFAGRWALPGGFVDQGEDTRQAAIRELREETEVEATPFCEVGVADAPGRDPRGWVVSVVWAFVVPAETKAHAGDDADAARWFPWDSSRDMAFDHADVLAKARRRFRELLALPEGWRAFVPEGHDLTEARVREGLGLD